MGGDVRSIAVSGLLAAQRALATASHNISNVNTPGYSRQRVDLVTNTPQFSGQGYTGTGVRVADTQRLYDAYLTNQVRTSTAAFSQTDSYHTYASQIDNALADPQTGLSPGLQAFFDGVHGLANDPSSAAARQVVVSQGTALVDRFHYLNQRFQELGDHVNSDITSLVGEANRIADAIASTNKDIASAPRGSNGGLPNDLLDRRDQFLAELSSKVSVSTIAQDDGTLSVFIGSGQPLVVGYQTQVLTVTPDKYDPLRSQVGFIIGGTVVDISSQIQGGKLGAALQFRNQVLDPARNNLGRVAQALTQTFNDQHRLGQDIKDTLGGNFFTPMGVEVLPRTSNTGANVVTASLVNANHLTTSDYQLVYAGSDIYTLTRLSDGQVSSINTGGSYPYATAEIDGMSLTIAAGAVVGDKSQISATRRGAQDINMALTDPSKVAAADPIRSSAAYANTGSVKISTGNVNSPYDHLTVKFTTPGLYNVTDDTSGATLAQGLAYSSGGTIKFNGVTFAISNVGTPPATGDKFYVTHGITSKDAANTGGASAGVATINPPDPNLQNAVTLTFNAPPTTYTVTGATTGTPITSVPYVSGQPISFNGWAVTLTGTPIAGDAFTVGPNTNGVSDNRNALRLAQLQTGKTIANGTQSYQENYAQLVADVGSKTHQLEITRSAQKVLQDQSTQTRDAVAGVNLDEEAADIVRFQQAYQAAAQVMSTYSSLFQTLMDAVRR